MPVSLPVAAMVVDPLMLDLAMAILVIVVIGFGFRRMGQPAIVGYIAAGVVLGPHGLALLSDVDLIGRIGAIGILLLLFYVGMEISPKQLAKSWRIPIIGTLVQVGVSVGIVAAIGSAFDWPMPRILLLGFVISFSSTAVILRLLADRNETDSLVGRSVVGVLIVQDLLLVPMLVVLGFLAGERPSVASLATMTVGGVVLTAFLIWILSKDRVHLPLGKWLAGDRELSVFVALLLCTGLAVLVGLMGLPTAFGAFAAGIIVNAAKETHWVHTVLDPFRVVFMATFFVSVGMLLDLGFVAENLLVVGLLLGAVLVTNVLINAGIFRAMGVDWRQSLYAGGLLSQIGELSFILVAAGLHAGVIVDFGYRASLAVIVLSLVLSPIWIAIIRRLVRL